MFSEKRAQFFPNHVVDGIFAKPVDASDFWRITAQLTRQIETSFSELGLYAVPEERVENGRFLRQQSSQMHHEYFLFVTAKNEPIGWSMGNMQDNATFFMAWTAILPIYQRRGIYSAFLRQLMPYLQSLGYERVISKHMVTNRPVLIAKLKAGFHISGLSLDERFGAQVTLAHYFHDDRLTGFSKAFSLESYA